MAGKPALFTKEQRADIERELSYPHGVVVMFADGHRLTLHVVKVKGLRYGVMVYIDGWFRGVDMRSDSALGQKFYREKTVSFVKARKGGLTKREAARLRKKYCTTLYEPYFPSAKSLLAKLQRTVENVEQVAVGYAAVKALEEVRNAASTA